MYFIFHKNTKDIREQPVSKIMTKRTLKTVHKDTSIPQLLKMLGKHKVTDFPVIDKKKNLIGDVDVRDLLPFAINPDRISEHEVIGVLGTNVNNIFGDTVEDIMNRHEESIAPDCPIEDAAFIMWKKNIHCLPVMKNKKLVGVISEDDIADMLIRRLKK